MKMNINAGVTVDSAELTDAALDQVAGGGKLGTAADIVQLVTFAWEVAKATYNAAKNSKGGYPDGERTDVMGNQG